MEIDRPHVQDRWVRLIWRLQKHQDRLVSEWVRDVSAKAENIKQKGATDELKSHFLHAESRGKCPHPKDSQVKGANQYCTWTRCLLCQTTYDKEFKEARDKTKKDIRQESKKTPSKPQHLNQDGSHPAFANPNADAEELRKEAQKELREEMKQRKRASSSSRQTVTNEMIVEALSRQSQVLQSLVETQVEIKNHLRSQSSEQTAKEQ